MIQKNLVYRKSPKGTQAIATRQHGLGPKLRSLLILVDGKRSCGELLQLSQLLGDAEQLLGQLLDQGFIEEGPAVAAGTSGTAGPDSSGVAAGPAVARPTPLGEAQRRVARRLVDILGPTAESLCMHIEGRRSAPDFKIAVKRAEAMVHDLRGSKLAAEFAAEMQAHMPSA